MAEQACSGCAQSVGDLEERLLSAGLTLCDILHLMHIHINIYMTMYIHCTSTLYGLPKTLSSRVSFFFSFF